MKKLLIPMILVVGLLTACGEPEAPPEPIGQVVEAVIVDKSEEKFKDEYDDTIIRLAVTIEKNDQKLKFFVDDATYNVVSKGTVISGAYFQDGYLGNITFPKIEEKNVDKSK